MIGKVARLAFLDAEMAGWIGNLAHEGARAHRSRDGLDVPADVARCIAELRAFSKAAAVPEVPVDNAEPTEWLTVRAAAMLAGVTRPTIYAWIDSGRLYGQSRSGPLRVDGDELRRIAAERARVKPSKAESSPELDRRAS